MTSVSAPPSRMTRGSAKERPPQLLGLVGQQRQPRLLAAEQDAALDLAGDGAGRAGDLRREGDRGPPPPPSHPPPARAPRRPRGGGRGGGGANRPGEQDPRRGPRGQRGRRGAVAWRDEAPDLREAE